MDMNATLDFDEEFVELAANFGESKKRLSSLQNRKESYEKLHQVRMEKLKARHKENLLELRRKHDKEIKNLEDEQSKERDELMKKGQNLINQVTEDINEEETCKNNIGKKLKRKYKDQDNDDIPECPVCLTAMIPPLEIYQCHEGHLICSDCRPRWREERKGCATCRDRRGYESRCRYVEDMIQKKMRNPV